MINIQTIALVLFSSLFASGLVAQQLTERPSRQYAGVSRVKVLNYEDCVELKNESAKVVLGHHVGGRILAYEANGKNVIFLDPREANWNPKNKNPNSRATAGRFDVGPEYLLPRSNSTWSGPWSVEVTGDRQARMTSQVDPEFKIQVTRDFKLDPNSSKLTITQTVENKSDQSIRQNFWSRTFAIHGGVAVVPCDPNHSILPNLYYMSQTRYLINFRPEDPAIRRVDDFIVVDKPAAFAKLGFDSTKGWAAYQTRTNQLFVKKFPVYPDKKYGDPGEANFALWYPLKQKLAACEIEPIGPLIRLQPGEKDSFSVDWWLLDRDFPASGVVDPRAVAKMVGEKCK